MQAYVHNYSITQIEGGSLNRQLSQTVTKLCDRGKGAMAAVSFVRCHKRSTSASVSLGLGTLGWTVLRFLYSNHSVVRCCMNLINLTSTVSPVLYGGIGCDIGVVTCNLCGRQCKGRRGLQEELQVRNAYILVAKPRAMKNKLNVATLHFIKFVKRSRNLAVKDTAFNATLEDTDSTLEDREIPPCHVIAKVPSRRDE